MGDLFEFSWLSQNIWPLTISVCISLRLSAKRKRYENIGIRNISMHFVTFAKLKKELGFYAPKIVGIWQIWHIFTDKWHSRIQGTWVSLILRHNGLKNFAKVYVFWEVHKNLAKFPLSYLVKTLWEGHKIWKNIPLV